MENGYFFHIHIILVFLNVVYRRIREQKDARQSLRRGSAYLKHLIEKTRLKDFWDRLSAAAALFIRDYNIRTLETLFRV